MQPKHAHAVLGAGDTVIVVGDTSPTGISDTINLYADKIKNWIIDGLAWHIAKMIVQRITASVVQWINSGFSGSPSFLSNPGGFFANIGDQVTGNFIAKTGILSGLCSPFNIDVRLSLALGQAGYGQVEKYTCTLSSVINNAKNTTVNGASIQGFIKGDYRQGGLPAFVEINLPSNNASGAYLKAQSDILSRIGDQQGAKQQQLFQGGGFLSWDKCDNISGSDAQSALIQAENDNSKLSGAASQLGKFGSQKITIDAGKPSGGATSIQKNVGKNGLVTYQSCETQTPGSVINGQLEKSLGSGIDQLNLADSINEIVDALLAQLVNQVLQAGLGSVSSKPSGKTQSFIDDLLASTTDSASYQRDVQNLQNGYTQSIADAQEIVDIRKDAIDAFDAARADYGFAQTCYKNLLASNNFSLYTNAATINANLTSIGQELTQMTSDQQTYIDSYTNALRTLREVTDASNNLGNTIGSPESLQKASDALQNTTIAKTDIKNESNAAQKETNKGKSIANRYDDQANAYLRQCRSMGGN